MSRRSTARRRPARARSSTAPAAAGVPRRRRHAAGAATAGAEHAAATHRRSPDAGRPRPDVARNSEGPGSGLVLGRDRHWNPRLPLLYGSAWKEDQTATAWWMPSWRALEGRHGVPAAALPRRFSRGGAADARGRARHRPRGGLAGKFTPALHQGADVPYDPAAPLSDQVAQSVQVSLKNLQVTSWMRLLHGPWRRTNGPWSLARHGAAGRIGLLRS